MPMPAQNKERIDNFIAVATERYAENPRGWEGLYERLFMLLDDDSRAYMISLWKPIANKKALQEWDEFFLECTINPAKLLKGVDTQQEHYERLMKQQMARNASPLMNANPLQNTYYSDPNTWSTRSSAGGIYPVTSNTSTSPTLVDRILGRK